MQAMLLCWFAAQQQTKTVRRQKFGLFYVKFNAEFNKLSLFFLKPTGTAQKMVKIKVFRKNADSRRLEAKG